MASLLIPSASTAGAAAVISLVAFSKSPSVSLALFRKLVALLLVLNWRALPGIWHAELWSFVPLLHARIRLRGLEKTMSIGRSPFRKITSHKRVTFDAGDWLGHLSNSSYGRALDTARFNWLLEVCGPALGQEKIWSPLAATAFSFFHEIPLLVKYSVEVFVSAWDDKWIYYTARFTSAPKKGSTERTLHCVAISKSCFKIHGSRLTIPPSRVLSIAGCGPDMKNWERATALRKSGKARKWLRYGAALVAKKGAANGNGNAAFEHEEGEEGWEESGMECYEEQRLKGLEVCSRMGDVTGWKELQSFE